VTVYSAVTFRSRAIQRQNHLRMVERSPLKGHAVIGEFEHVVHKSYLLGLAEVRLELGVEIEDVEIPVVGGGNREVATAHVEVNNLTYSQLAAVVEIRAGEFHFPELRRFESAEPVDAVHEGPRTLLGEASSGEGRIPVSYRAVDDLAQVRPRIERLLGEAFRVGS